MLRPEAETKFLRLKWRRAFDRWRGKTALLVIAAKGGFDPNQPRVPAGNPNGGQWSGGGSESGSGSRARRQRDSDEGRVLSDTTPDNLQKPGVRLAQARGSGGGSSVRFRGQRLPATVGQRMRFAAADRRAKKLIRQVNDIDRFWKPRLSATDPSTINGAIAIRRGEAREAEARLRELARQSPTQLIKTYRTLNNSRDLFGKETWPRDRGTVAVTTINRIPIVGINSGVPTFKARDQRAADIARDTLVAKYPDVMNTRNIGQMPNNALYHAEATILLRAERAQRASLFGHKITVRSDRNMCGSCKRVLPKLGLELGNPTVTFINPNGTTRTMWNGKWID